MSTIANVFKTNRDNATTMVSSYSFEDYEDALTFKESFGNRYLHDRADSFYYIELVSVTELDSTDELVLMAEISIENNSYVQESTLELRRKSGFVNPALERAYECSNGAYALNKKGEVIELVDGNVGIHSFYTCDMSLTNELNENYT